MKMCDCNQGRWPCTCKMAPKLGEAVRRFGFVESSPVARAFPDAMAQLGHVTPECFCVEHGVHIERLKKEVDALQELLTQRDMEIDYLATARPTVLRLDWYTLALGTLANIALHYAFI